MKKLVTIFILLVLLVFIGVLMMVSMDNNYIIKLENEIEDNTGIRNIEYVNKYDNNYIVLDGCYLYLFNSLYEEIYKVEIERIHKNNNDYEIIYRNKTVMYMDDYKNEDKLIFKYYDIYTYELVDEIVVGDD